jgi:hypothetical protein
MPQRVKHRGRRASLALGQVQEILKRSAAGDKKAGLAMECGVSRQTLYSAIGKAEVHAGVAVMVFGL